MKRTIAIMALALTVSGCGKPQRMDEGQEDSAGTAQNATRPDAAATPAPKAADAVPTPRPGQEKTVTFDQRMFSASLMLCEVRRRGMRSPGDGTPEQQAEVGKAIQDGLRRGKPALDECRAALFGKK